jgi:large subunit ribosomal protein L21
LYAIIEIKGRQFVVREGDIVQIPFDSELEAGKTVKADRVLLVRDDKTTKIGSPDIAGASVSLEVTGSGRDRKILVYKKKRRKKYRRKQGHRQQYTEAVVARIAAA